MYISEVQTTSSGGITSHAAKCPEGKQPREYLRELVVLLAAESSDEKLKAAYGIQTSKVTSATLIFAI